MFRQGIANAVRLRRTLEPRSRGHTRRKIRLDVRSEVWIMRVWIERTEGRRVGKMFGRIVRTEVYADGALAAIDVARDRVRASGYVPTYTVSRPYRLGSDRWRIELAVRKDR